MSILIKKTLLVCAILSILCSGAYALDLPLGNKALNTGITPPPGFNYIMELDYFFGPDYDAAGKDKRTNTSVLSNGHVLEWNTTAKIFGASYSNTIIVPLVGIKVDEGDKNIYNASGLGDPYLEPVILGWSSKWIDSKFILGLNLPLGSKGVTFDHFSAAFSGAFTGFLNPSKTLTLSILPTIEVHARNRSNDITEGVDFALKWGLGYKFGLNDLGIIGYSAMQLSNDTGKGAVIKASDDYVHAVGLQYNRFIPEIRLLISILVDQDLAASNHTKGTKIHLVFVKMI